MEITWFGRSTFRLKGKEATVITDPPLTERGQPQPRFVSSADIVTMGTLESDERQTDFSSVPKVIHGPGEYEVKGVFVTGIEDGRRDDKARGRHDVVYLLELDELVVCHLGRLARPLTGEQTDQITRVDVLLVPVGGHEQTLDATAAAEMIGQFDPRVIVPMFFKSGPDDPLDLDPLDKFAREMGLKEWEPQPRLNVTHSSLPAVPGTVVLAPRA